MRRKQQIRQLQQQLQQQRTELGKQLNHSTFHWASGLAATALSFGFIYQRLQPSAKPLMRFAAAQATRNVLPIPTD